MCWIIGSCQHINRCLEDQQSTQGPSSTKTHAPFAFSPSVHSLPSLFYVTNYAALYFSFLFFYTRATESLVNNRKGEISKAHLCTWTHQWACFILDTQGWGVPTGKVSSQDIWRKTKGLNGWGASVDVRVNCTNTLLFSRLLLFTSRKASLLNKQLLTDRDGLKEESWALWYLSTDRSNFKASSPRQPSVHQGI